MEPTDVAAFKIYLDEVKSRLIYGAARADGVRAGRVTAPSAAESKLYTMLDFTKKRASYLIVGPDGFCPPRSPGGRGMKNMSAAAANFEKRGVVSYRFRKIEESIV